MKRHLTLLLFTLPLILWGQTNHSTMQPITTYDALMQAVQQGQSEISVARSITVPHALILPRGTAIKGLPQENGERPMLLFPSSDGLGLTADNQVTDLSINAPVSARAVFNTAAGADLGTFSLSRLLLQGQLSVIMRPGATRANVYLQDIHIAAADTRHYLEQPQKYGVNVLQGALTLYNMNGDPNSLMQVRAERIAIGRPGIPVAGSGIFIAGAGDAGGRTHVSLLTTGAVYSTGKIPYGVADYITGAVFILNGAHAQQVITQGELVTYGVNDMVTDVWGSVEEWTANGPITSYGPSGIGFVNFGTVRSYTANAPVRTYGEGARGYNQYDGTVEQITFSSIETFGHGSVGVQISKPIGRLTIKGNLTTHGSLGNSLVKGVIVPLPAYALSIKAGGRVEHITVEGNITTYGNDVVSYITEPGAVVEQFTIGGTIQALGRNAQPQDLR